MTTPNQTQNLDFDAYGKRLVAAALEYRRAQNLADAARQEVVDKERFATEAARVAEAAYVKLHDLFMGGV